MPYGTDQGFEAWLEAMGYELPDNAPDVSVLRARGSSYLDGAYEAYWTGQRTDPFVQENAWPRTGATLNCVTPVPDDLIPPVVITASYRAAWLEASASGVLTGIASTDRRTKSEKVDVISVEYFDDKGATVGGGPVFVDPEIDGAMRAFICDNAGNGAFIWSVGT